MSCAVPDSENGGCGASGEGRTPDSRSGPVMKPIVCARESPTQRRAQIAGPRLSAIAATFMERLFQRWLVHVRVVEVPRRSSGRGLAGFTRKRQTLAAYDEPLSQVQSPRH